MLMGAGNGNSLIALKMDDDGFTESMVGGWVARPQCRIMPLRGPTCKIARLQAGLKFPCWTVCGNIMQVFDEFKSILFSLTSSLKITFLFLFLKKFVLHILIVILVFTFFNSRDTRTDPHRIQSQLKSINGPDRAPKIYL